MDNQSNQPSQDSSRNSLVHQRTWIDHLWVIREHWILALLAAVAVTSVFVWKKSQTIPLYRSIAILLYEPQRDRVINIQGVTDSGRGPRNVTA